MKVKDIVGQIEHSFGRKSHNYIMSLMNDGLDEIAQTARANSASAGTQIEKDKRWYDLDNSVMIDVYRVEVLDSDLNLREIPRMTSVPEIGDDT